MPASTTPFSTLTFKPLAGKLQPSGAAVRTGLNALKTRKDDTLASVISALLSRLEAVESVLRSAAPEVETVRLSASDIDSFIIGGELGPGELEVKTGGPDFSTIAWIGTSISSSSVTVTSITSGGGWTTAAPHGLVPGDRVYYTPGTWKWQQVWIVDTTPTSTTFTTTTNAGVGGSGGSIQKVFVGGHFAELAIGGDLGAGPENAPLIADSTGLYLTDVDISIAGLNADGDDTEITIRPGELVLENFDALWTLDLSTGGVRVYDDSAAAYFAGMVPGAFEVSKTTGATVDRVRMEVTGVGPFYGLLRLTKGGVNIIELDANTGNITCTTINGSSVASPGNYYTKAEVDTLLAAKSNVGHVHNTINITGTAGTVAHTHTGQVS